MSKFKYKGYDVNTIISSGNSSVNTGVPTTAYEGFPSYNPSTNDDLDRVETNLLFQIANTDVVDRSNIQAASYKSPSSESGSYKVPEWCKGVKFYISSMKGAQGAKGAQGPQGAKGVTGDTGPSDTIKNCMQDNANRKSPGGPGGDGGDGGPGGAGGEGGEGGQGVYLYRTELIPVKGGESYTYSNNVSGATKLTISDSYTFTTNNGNAGKGGNEGGQGDKGAKGGQGNAGKRNCPTSNPGNQGAKGATGDTGKGGDAGTKGTNGNYTAKDNTALINGSSNTSEITVYFFTT